MNFRRIFGGASLMVFTITLASCKKNEENSAEKTFGIKHDLSLSDFEEIATNASPYNTEEYPDFSPIVCFSYSDDGSDNYESIATGTLVSESWILTAGHNFFSSDE